ncbi:50S ribosomal protein L4 [Patescibacteria group bacterium]|nr:50S ribosomal protein L4 [Patescibacteria group bacterium]
MLVKTYNQKGEEIGQTKLPKEIFEVKINTDLVHQVAVSQMARKRIRIAKAKTRAEVRGGGRKPWAQKGTGRARHGSIRSPLWRGGGVTFGPRTERVFKKKINKKMRKKALFMVLSAKAKENLLLILDSLKLDQPKTKLMEKILKGLKSKIKTLKEKSILIALSQKDENIIRASRNIPNLQTIETRNLNVLDLLSFKYLMMPKGAIKVIKETFLK